MKINMTVKEMLLGASDELKDQIRQALNEERVELWRPKIGERMWWIGSGGDLWDAELYGLESICAVFNYYRTKDQARRQADRERARREIDQWTDHLNEEDIPPNSAPTYDLWYILYNFKRRELEIGKDVNTTSVNCYFYSKESAQIALNNLSEHAKSYLRGEI